MSQKFTVCLTISIAAMLTSGELNNAVAQTAPAAVKIAPASTESPYGIDLGPGGPVPKLVDGHPDFSGYWKPTRSKTEPKGNIGKDLPGYKLPLTPAGEAVLKDDLTKTIDPKSLCIQAGMPRLNVASLTFQLLSTPTHIGFLYVSGHFRLIPIDGRQADPDPDPHFFGNPIGRWEGDALVIDSKGFKDSKDGKIWIDENANPMSDQLHLVETWTRPDSTHLKVHMVIDDPKYYTHSFTYDVGFVSGQLFEDVPEYACNENNRDAAHLSPGPAGPIGPDGKPMIKSYGNLPKTPPSPDFYDKN